MFPLGDVGREFERVVTDFFGDFEAPKFCGQGSFPALNIWEDAQSLYVEAEVPGLRMDDLEILVVGDELTIKGQRKADGDRERTFHRQERSSGTFTRVLTLPVEVDVDNVEATLKNGVLTIVLPKAKASLVRKIAVKTA